MDRYNMTDVVNKDWEQDWKDIIQTDQHYDCEYLIRLIVHKLGLMIKTFKEANRDDLEFAIHSMDLCYNLGLKILTFNYGYEADIIFDEYGDSSWLVDKVDSEDYIEWNRLSDDALNNREADIKRFFMLIGSCVNSWWF